MSIVKAPAKTGTARSNNRLVTNIHQTNKDKRSSRKYPLRMFMIVVVKLIALKMLPAPARCRLKIIKSIEEVAENCKDEIGGYIVQPTWAPPDEYVPDSKRRYAGGNTQKLRAFTRGRAISAAPSIRGTSQLPNPPINKGITKKKIITNACEVTIDK